MLCSLEEVQAEVSNILKATVEVCNKNNITYYCQAGTVLGAVRHHGPIPWDYDADIIVPINEMDRFVECCVRDLPKKYWVNYYTVFPKGYRHFPRIGKVGYTTDHLHLDVFPLIGLPDEREKQLSMIAESVKYRDEMISYRRGFNGIASLVKHGKFRKCFRTIKQHIQKDTSFIQKLDELCRRYPYEQAEFIMNPFGKYKAKNIFCKSVYGKGQIVPYLDFEVRVPSELDFYLTQYYGDYMKYPSQAEIDRAKNHRYEIKGFKHGSKQK